MAESTTDLPPSKLGTKQHWDDVYASEVVNFEEIGDEGEIWFGEDSIEKMVDWIQENVHPEPAPYILEVGSGNGTLLFALTEAGYPAHKMHGVDYSTDAVKLARAIAKARGDDAEDISFGECDFLNAFPPALESIQKLSEGEPATWDLVLDKGTFDAIALAERDESGKLPADGYPLRIAQVVKPGGYFLIVSCNFTEIELKAKFVTSQTGLEYHSRLSFPTFSFGGKQGNVYSGAAFRKSL